MDENRDSEAQLLCVLHVTSDLTTQPLNESESGDDTKNSQMTDQPMIGGRHSSRGRGRGRGVAGHSYGTTADAMMHEHI